METFSIIFVALVLLIFVTIKYKLHPVFSLIITSIVVGFLFGFDSKKIVTTIAEGFGKTLSSIGLIIAFGTTIGVFLEKNGGTKVIAQKMLKVVRSKQSPFAMNIIGFIISIPVFCDSGFVILSSLNKTLSKKTGIKLVVFAVALSTGLYAAHVFVPPTPGPLAAAAVIDADIGLVMLLGLGIAIPVALMGYFWGAFIGKKLPTNEVSTDDDLRVSNSEYDDKNHTPSLWATLLPLFIPIILIALKSIAEHPTWLV